MVVLYGALVACIINLFLIPIIVFLSHKKGWFDEINERKIHTGNISRLGGIGIFWSFAIVLLVMAGFFLKNSSNTPLFIAYWPVTISLFIIHFMGLADDFLNLSAKFRLVVQLVLSIIIVLFGFKFNTIFLPFGLGQVDFGIFSYIITILWIVGIINAVNLIDGLDGLCGGISIIASFTYGIMYLERGEVFPALIAFILVGSLAGYLFYNFPPAKIFMGDSGSTFLGFTLAILPLLGGHSGINENAPPILQNVFNIIGSLKIERAAEIGIWNSITILIIPIYDTFAAIIRRAKKGVSFSTPDKEHLHHKLMNLGFSTRQILAIIYAANMVLGAVAISSLYTSSLVNFILIIISWLAFALLFFLLHYCKEKKIVLINRE